MSYYPFIRQQDPNWPKRVGAAVERHVRDMEPGETITIERKTGDSNAEVTLTFRPWPRDPGKPQQ